VPSRAEIADALEDFARCHLHDDRDVLKRIEAHTRRKARLAASGREVDSGDAGPRIARRVDSNELRVVEPLHRAGDIDGERHRFAGVGKFWQINQNFAVGRIGDAKIFEDCGLHTFFGGEGGTHERKTKQRQRTYANRAA
jgi:hypothetical protein